MLRRPSIGTPGHSRARPLYTPFFSSDFDPNKSRANPHPHPQHRENSPHFRAQKYFTKMLTRFHPIFTAAPTTSTKPLSHRPKVHFPNRAGNEVTNLKLPPQRGKDNSGQAPAPAWLCERRREARLPRRSSHRRQERRPGSASTPNTGLPIARTRPAGIPPPPHRHAWLRCGMAVRWPPSQCGQCRVKPPSRPPDQEQADRRLDSPHAATTQRSQQPPG